MKRAGLLFLVSAIVLTAGTVKISSVSADVGADDDKPPYSYQVAVGQHRPPDMDLEHLSIIAKEEEHDISRLRKAHEEPGGADSGTAQDDPGIAEAEYDADPDAETGVGDCDDTDYDTMPELVEPGTDYIYLGDWTVTAYCPCPECCGEYSSGITASGTIATAGRTVACNVLPIGSMVMIDGWVYTVEDTGWSPYDEWIDIYFDSHEEALQFGIREMEVYLVDG